MDKAERLDVEILSSINFDAQVMERLSSSPFVMDIYGYCGTTVSIETMDDDLHSTVEEIVETSYLTDGDKLQLAIAMASGLADLHGYEGGVIYSSDLKLEHWLVSPNGEVKLSDFNLADYLSWNATESSHCPNESERQEDPSFRFPPENFMKEPKVDESLDVWAFGWSLFKLLSGGESLPPGINDERMEEMQLQLRKGDLSFMEEINWHDSYIERQLVEIVKQCWSYKKEDRPFMGDVVRTLYEVKKEAWKRGETTSSKWVNNPYD
jgi:serine/threonine protein kinase